MNSIKEILTKTSVNTLVIDAKTDNGHVLFDSQSPETDVLKNERIKYLGEDQSQEIEKRRGNHPS